MVHRFEVKKILLSILFLLLLAGSMFLVSKQYSDLYETYRKYWTIVVGGLVLVFSYFKKPSTLSILCSIVFMGIAECVFSLLQFCKVLPSYNSYFSYTGSFDNPAVFALVLSVCIPIAIWLALQGKRKWICIAIATLMLVFIAFSESRTGILAAIASSFVICIMENKSMRRVILKVGIPLAVIILIGLYYFKEDSANGRLLIWKVSLNMVLDKPFFGWGNDGFSSMYMTYQANYFTDNPDSQYILLADNPSHPFNEFISIMIKYGLAGLVVAILFFVFIALRLYKSDIEHKSLLLGLLLAITIWCMFSYPLSIPFVWIITIYIVYYSMPKGNIYIALAGIAISVMGIVRFFPEREWKYVSEQSIAGQTLEMLPFFETLSGKLSSNSKFMYNWAAELHYAHMYEKSAEVFDRNLCRLNDYDVHILLGDDYQKMGKDSLAIQHYDIASQMVPGKFLPHYYKMNLFLENGDTINAVMVANTIINKPVKVQESRSIKRIVSEAETLLSKISK